MRNIKLLCAITIIILITGIFILSQIEKLEFVAWQGDNIEISEGNKEILRNAKLGVFSERQINGKNIIYPSAEGTYKFNITNSSKYKMIYNIKFAEEMTNKINIKYKLKKDNEYIRGNETTYVDIDKLGLESVIILPKSNNRYTLEWKWEEGIYDTEIASLEEEQDYTFRMQIVSNIYDKQKNTKN